MLIRSILVPYVDDPLWYIIWMVPYGTLYGWSHMVPYMDGPMWYLIWMVPYGTLSGWSHMVPYMDGPIWYLIWMVPYGTLYVNCLLTVCVAVGQWLRVVNFKGFTVSG